MSIVSQFFATLLVACCLQSWRTSCWMISIRNWSRAVFALCATRTTFWCSPRPDKAARRVYGSVGRYFTRKLKLIVNRQKSRICSTDGVEFLGFIFMGYGGQIHISPKNTKKFKDRVREITRRKRGVSMLAAAKNFADISKDGWAISVSCPSQASSASSISGFAAASGVATGSNGEPRTRIAKLRKLGVRRREAIMHGISSKGPWVLSKPKRCTSLSRSTTYGRRTGES